MSSFNRAASYPRRKAAWVSPLLASVFFLSACTIQPVYGPSPDGTATGQVLTSIAIDPVTDRVAQVVRNKLISGFGSDGGASPVYRMHLTVNTSEVALGIGAAGASPTNSVSVAVTYVITRFDSGKVVAKSAARATASFDIVNQEFANTRARLDAQNRAAATVADQVRIRVAAAIAHG
jgi:LPS-assembly lipoprotein